MDIVFQIAALAVIAAICCCMLRAYVGGITIGLSIVSCVLILLAALRFLSPVVEILERMKMMSGVSDVIAAPLIKAIGIGVLTQIACAICDDAGEKTLHQAVEMAGMILALYVSLPLLSSVLDLLEEILSE